MIVRISTEGQYRLPSSHLDRLSEIDEELISVVASDDHEKFQSLFNEMLDLVRSNGEALDPSELLESAIVLPPPDTTFDEARNLFVGEGVVPADL